MGFCRISKPPIADQVNYGARPWMNRHTQPQRNALSDRGGTGLHSLVRGVPALSYRHLEEMMEERGVSVDHSSINRWAVRFLPHIEKTACKHKHPVGGSWRMDETSIKIRGVWKYLYRAVDKQGKTVDFLLSAKRDMAAAQRFFDKAMGANGDPAKVAMDKSGANKRRLSMRSMPAATWGSLDAKSSTSTTSSNRTIAPSSG
jgi:transposase-like protein